MANPNDKKISDLSVGEAVAIDGVVHKITSIRDAEPYKEIKLESLTYPHTKMCVNCHHDSTIPASALESEEYTVVEHVEKFTFKLECGDTTINYDLGVTHVPRVLQALMRKKKVVVIFNKYFGKKELGYIHIQ